MATYRPATSDLRERVVREALTLVAEHGLGRLSIREVSRRLRVSHQAPYTMFPTREHLVAAIAARAFAHFAEFLDARDESPNPFANLRALGGSYLTFAADYPLEYQLMFGVTLPQARDHPEMTQRAQHAFDILQSCIADVARASGRPLAADEIALEAMFVWSAVHGLASMRLTSAVQTLAFSSLFHERIRDRIFDRIDVALSNELPEGRARHGS